MKGGAPAAERRDAEPARGTAQDSGGEQRRPPAGAGGDAGPAPRKAQSAEPEPPAKAGGPARKAGETTEQEQGRSDTKRQPEAVRKEGGDTERENGKEGAPRKATTQDATPRKGEPDQAGQRQEPANRAETQERQRDQNPGTREGNPTQRQPADAAQADRGRNGQNGGARVEGRVRLEPDRAAVLHRSIVERYRTGERAGVSLSIGVAVPRSVRVRALPPEIIRDYPEFRDDEFFVEQDEVVIVDPGTREVVEIIGGDGDGGPVVEGARRPSHGRNREEIVRVVGGHRQDFTGGAAGPELRAPPSAVIRPLPPSLASDMPDAEGYGYFIDRENRVIVVDRDTREVIDIVE